MAKNERQYWYIATLVIASKVEAGNDDPTCEEQIRIIRAPNADVAYEKALQIGKGEEHSYQNVHGQTVMWEFVGLDDLDELDDTIHDGVEIRSRLFGHRNPSSLVRSKADLSVFAGERNPDSLWYKIKTENIPAQDD